MDCLPSALPTPVFTRVRLRFRKDGDLRFLSHHDLIRLFERLMRRAALPFRNTEGFHPKPKMAFPSALSLGIVGHQEAIEIEFDGEQEPAAIRATLAALCPEGLTLLEAKALPRKVTGQPVLAEYLLPLPAEARVGLQEKLNHLLAQPSLIIERTKQRELGRPPEEELGEERLDAPFQGSPGKKKPADEVKKLDLRPYLSRLRLEPAGLILELHITPQGTARPEEVLRLLGLDRLLNAGDAVLERTRLVLADETEPVTETPAARALAAITAPARPANILERAAYA